MGNSANVGETNIATAVKDTKISLEFHITQQKVNLYTKTFWQQSNRY